MLLAKMARADSGLNETRVEPGKKIPGRLAKFNFTLIMSLKTVTVFCGSSSGNDPRFEESARGKVVSSNIM